jgi:hypothetical protein
VQLSSSYLKGLQNEGWVVERPEQGLRLVKDEDAVEMGQGNNWFYVRARLPNLEMPDSMSLRLNNHFHLTKLCRNNEGRLYLSTEWPTAGLSFRIVHLTLKSTQRALEILRDPVLRSDQFAWTTDMTSNPSQGSRVALYIPKERIWQFLRQIDRRGWSLIGEPENTRWRFGYLGHNTKFELHMSFTAHWTYFQAPIRVLPAKHLKDTLFRHLLYLNRRLMMAKFRLTPNEQIVLGVQCPTERLDFQLFELCMDGMAEYLDRMGPEVILLATNDRLSEFVRYGRLKEPDVLGLEFQPQQRLGSQTEDRKEFTSEKQTYDQ